MLLKNQGKEFSDKDYCTYLEELVENDANLHESPENYRIMVEQAWDMIAIIDADSFAYRYVSPSYMKQLAYEDHELLGRCCFELVHPEDRADTLLVLRDGIKDGNGIIQYRMLRKDNTEIWVETNGKLTDEEDRSQGILLNTRNISSHKRVEEALFNKVNYLNTLIDNMNELFYIIDADYRIIFANQKTLDVTRYTVEEGFGRSILDFIPDMDKEYVMQNARNRLEKGTTGSYEHYITCKDGREILIKVKSSPIIEDGEITGIMVLAEDITQQRKIEKEMIRLGQLHTVGEMAVSIGHEIRNPMTTVQGFLQIMSQNEQLREQQPYFDLMLEEIGRANSIISEVLFLAKDKMVDLQCHNINKIVQALTPVLVADAIKAEKCINFMLGNVCDLLLDEKEIRQLILNLVHNALEAMSIGGTVLIKTYLEADGVILSVQDEGTGIALELKERLGTPFLTSKENGIGLGLAVCYSIVTRHHAQMDYESSPAGTVFRVKFPAVSK